MIFDTHAHYDDRKFDDDREELLKQLRDAGIGRVVDIGADIDSTRKAVALAKQYDFIYAAAGVHPSDVDCLDERSFQWLTGLVEESVEEKGKIVAVGEDQDWIIIGKRTRSSVKNRNTGLSSRWNWPGKQDFRW